MAAPKKWKSGRRAGTLRRPAIPIEFTRDELYTWLWNRVGLNARQCHYCGAPVDILILTLDHAIPRAAGGRFALDNMRICCEQCNQRKGNLTETAYLAILGFSRQLSPYDQETLLKRLAAAHHGSPARFFRKPEQKRAPSTPPPPKQDGFNYELGAF
ncbi:MAG: HNH endonuclease [Patescibacteria group bacterium]|nr:HNH endonuclease [Patescibacteria group bacterium]